MRFIIFQVLPFIIITPAARPRSQQGTICFWHSNTTACISSILFCATRWELPDIPSLTTIAPPGWEESPLFPLGCIPFCVLFRVIAWFHYSWPVPSLNNSEKFALRPPGGDICRLHFLIDVFETNPNNLWAVPSLSSTSSPVSVVYLRC